MPIPRDQAHARAAVHPGCLELDLAELPTHVIRVTGRAFVATDPDQADAINTWLEGRLHLATWVRWPNAPGEDVIATTDRLGAGVLAAWEQFGAAAALRLIHIVNDMPDPETEEEPLP